MKTITSIALHSTKLLDRVKEAIRYKHYGASTEEVYVCGVAFHPISQDATPKRNGAVEVAGFMSYLANEKAVSASTHKQALARTRRTALNMFFPLICCGSMRRSICASNIWIFRIRLLP